MKINPELLIFARKTAEKAMEQAAEIGAYLEEKRKCLEITRKGTRCKNWATSGDDKQRCKRHGGTPSKPNCDCLAYPFPHRKRGGNCNFPFEPKAISYKTKRTRRNKRMKKAKKWLKDLGI